MPTLGQALVQVREMEGRAATYRTAASYLRMRYIGRDSTPAVAQIRAADNSPVGEDVIEAAVNAMEQEAKELEQAVRAAKAVPVGDE